MPKLIFVCIAAAFLSGIVTDDDPNHPNGPNLVITQGKGTDRPVYQVSDSVYIKEKIREGILEEVRDFEGVPRNSPEHPDHIDNPANQKPDDQDMLKSLNAIAVPAGYSEEEVSGIVQRALDAQAKKNQETQQKTVEAAVEKAVAAAKLS